MHDLFISHASEDKDAIARPLAEAFRERGWSVWYDEFEIVVGSGLRAAIDKGLAESKFGLVILSPSFFAGKWTRRELDGLTSRELVEGAEQRVILPVWHEVGKEDVARFSPPLANRMAIISTVGVPAIVDQIEYVLRTSASASIVADTGDQPGLFVQDNISRSARGTLRGMHYEVGAGQAKLVRCSRGEILDVVVDLRPTSSTFGQWESIVLSDQTMRDLFIPIGFAHGFYVLSDTADVTYKCSRYYAPEAARALRWNDPDVAIDWPAQAALISERDANAPLLRDIIPELEDGHGPAGV